MKVWCSFPLLALLAGRILWECWGLKYVKNKHIKHGRSIYGYGHRWFRTQQHWLMYVSVTSKRHGSCSYDAGVFFSTVNRVREAMRASAALLVGCFVLRWCVCVYTKRKRPTDRQDSLGSFSLKPRRDGERWRESEMSSNLPPRWKLGQQQEITRLLCCDSEAKTCWVHNFNCSETLSPHSAGYLRGVNENLLSNSVWISNCIALHMCTPLCTANPAWRNCTTDQ